mgnify:CR=1 FL=1
MSEWDSFIHKGTLDEERFAQRHLSNIKWSNNYQNMHEHWDMEGGLKGKTLKFDVKGMKKINRRDDSTQDKFTWIEGTNVKGNPGWLKGRADYIVFERNEYWLLVNREELWDFVQEKLKKNSYAEGKKPYHVYQRWGKKDKITLVPFTDIEDLKDIEKLDK